MPSDSTPILGAPDHWVAPLARALPALTFGLVVTFTQQHTAGFGLISFGVFAVVTAAVLLASGLRGSRPVRGLVIVQGVVTAVAGIAALLVPEHSVGYLVLVVSAWAIVTGALETVNGIRFRRSHPGGRDWLITGVLTLALGAVMLVVPEGYADPYAVDDVSGVVTADILLVGIVGAWAIIVGVQLAIEAFSLRAPRPASAKSVNA